LLYEYSRCVLKHSNGRMRVNRTIILSSHSLRGYSQDSRNIPDIRAKRNRICRALCVGLFSRSMDSSGNYRNRSSKDGGDHRILTSVFVAGKGCFGGHLIVRPFALYLNKRKRKMMRSRSRVAVCRRGWWAAGEVVGYVYSVAKR